MSPNDRKYTREHEWAKLEDAGSGQARVGITDYAQDQLGDVVYIELPRPGAAVKHLEKMGEVESVKAVSDLYSPVTGEVLEANEALVDRPELVNEDPFEAGWMLRVNMSDTAELDQLMSSEEYEAYVSGL